MAHSPSLRLRAAAALTSNHTMTTPPIYCSCAFSSAQGSMKPQAVACLTPNRHRDRHGHGCHCILVCIQEGPFWRAGAVRPGHTPRRAGSQAGRAVPTTHITGILTLKRARIDSLPKTRAGPPARARTASRPPRPHKRCSGAGTPGQDNRRRRPTAVGAAPVAEESTPEGAGRDPRSEIAWPHRRPAATSSPRKGGRGDRRREPGRAVCGRSLSGGPRREVIRWERRCRDSAWDGCPGLIAPNVPRLRDHRPQAGRCVPAAKRCRRGRRGPARRWRLVLRDARGPDTCGRPRAWAARRRRAWQVGVNRPEHVGNGGAHWQVRARPWSAPRATTSHDTAEQPTPPRSESQSGPGKTVRRHRPAARPSESRPAPKMNTGP